MVVSILQRLVTLVTSVVIGVVIELCIPIAISF